MKRVRKADLANLFDSATADVPGPSAVDWQAFNEAKHCHWPVADPAYAEAFLFCGLPIDDGQVYCKGHCKLAYNGTGNYKPRGGITARVR